MMPIRIRSLIFQRLQFLMDPIRVFMDKIQDFLAQFLLAVAVSINGILPVHVEYLRSDMSLQKSRSVCLKIKTFQLVFQTALSGFKRGGNACHIAIIEDVILRCASAVKLFATKVNDISNNVTLKTSRRRVAQFCLLQDAQITEVKPIDALHSVFRKIR